MMKLDDFKRLLDVRGSDLERWPANQGDQARALLACSEPARQLHRESRWLDQALWAQPLGLDEQKSVQRLRAALRKRLVILPDPAKFALGHLFFQWAQVGLLIAIAALAIAVGWSVSDAGHLQGGREDLGSVLMRDNLEDAP
jgi:hypothetical protein